MKDRKGQVANLVPAILGLTLAALVLIFGLIMNAEVVDTQVTGAANCNATVKTACDVAYQQGNTTLAAMGTFANFWELIVLAIVIGVVITILFANFGRSER